MITHTRRLALLAAALTTAATLGCVGPQGSHREGNSWPTAPNGLVVFELFGLVRDIDSQQPLVGAKVDAGNAFALTDAEGRYSIPGLTGSFAQVIVSRTGYDTTRVNVTPVPGRVQVIVQLRATPAAIAAP